MDITVRLFATLRQQAGWKEKVFKVEPATTIAGLVEIVEQHEPILQLRGRTLYAAVNMEYAPTDRLLVEGDEVAFFPPVSGGAARLWRMTEHG